MERFTFLIIILLFIGCKEKNSPKATVADFIISLKKLDFEKASSFLTKETQPIFFNTKTEFQTAWNIEQEMKISDSMSKKEIVKDYDLEHLTESIMNTNAIVQSSDSSSKIILEKVDGTWEIVCTENFLNEILKGKDESVEKAYNVGLITYFQEQVDVARGIIKFLPNTEVTAIKEKIAEITSLYNDDTEKEMSNILIMNSKQNELQKLISDFLKPMNNQSDIANEFEHCKERIIQSKLEYNRAVSEYKSGFGPKRNFKIIPVEDAPNSVLKDASLMDASDTSTNLLDSNQMR